MRNPKQLETFELYTKYVVLSVSDINKHLPPIDIRSLKNISKRLAAHRLSENKYPNKGIFIRKDSPIYEEVLNLLQLSQQKESTDDKL